MSAVIECYVDSRERLSVPYLKSLFSIIEVEELPVGDVLFPLYNSIAEIKIGADITDVERVQDELSRMAIVRAKHPEQVQHLYYCDTDSYKIFRLIFDKEGVLIDIDTSFLMQIIGYCNLYGVNFHYAKSPKRMMTQMKRHLEKYFRPRTFVKKSQLPTFCARALAQIKGVSDEKALKWAVLVKHQLSNVFHLPLDPQLVFVFGMKADKSEMKEICYQIDELFEWGDANE